MDHKQARYHVFWHKNELFFDKYELRYCLLKKFRLNEENLPLPTEGAFKHEQITSHLFLH